MVASQINPELVQGLVNAASEELRALAPTAVLHFIQVPGTFEIPFGAKLLIEHKKVDVVIALGAVITGATDHARIISECAARSLQEVSLEKMVPILHGIVSADTMELARERCLGEEMNRGTEAARAAVEIFRTLEEIRKE
jgi:6,7-dimethyl-8-ribityllumazine synthase